MVRFETHPLAGGYPNPGKWATWFAAVTREFAYLLLAVVDSTACTIWAISQKFSPAKEKQKS